MAVSSLVAASGGKTAYRLSLTSGSSWTVPAGVTYINVTCIGGGGGGGGAWTSSGTKTSPSAGGTTSFTGASSASGGSAGVNHGANYGGPFNYRSGVSASSNTGLGGGYGFAAIGSTSYSYPFLGAAGANGAVVSSTLSTTPGASISYSIGSGGSGGGGEGNGGAGGSGRIDIEYWV